MLYGSECWKISQEIAKKVWVFIRKCLRIILCVKCPQKISNAEVRNICEQDDITVELARRKWRWVGHILRKDRGQKHHKKSYVLDTRWEKETKDRRKRAAAAADDDDIFFVF